MQLCKNCTEVYFSLSNGCFGTELMSVCRIAAVLCMQVADVFAENVKCVCRVCFSVKNQICSVQIHIKIIRADGFKAAQHGNGGFLTGFKQQALPVFLQMLCNSAHSDAEAAEIGIIGIFRNKSHMGYDICNAELVGKISTVAEVFDPHLPVFHRDKSKGELSVVKVPCRRSGPAAPECGNGDLVLFQKCF